MKILAQKKYPGRGILIGTSCDNKETYILYFIMGRSNNSRNRIFTKTEDGIQTEAYRPELLEDPSLIIYHPLRRVDRRIVVTNGDQTDTIRDALVKGKSFVEALETREFEPDAPHFTPRISALVEENGDIWFSILKAGDSQGKHCIRNYFHYEAVAGEAHLIHTYEEDENPLKSFVGEPHRLSLTQDFSHLAEEVWQSLDGDNKISLYACCVNKESKEFTEKIFNKYQ